MTTRISITMPHAGWQPRAYQQRAWYELRTQRVKRFFFAFHRRAGKDEMLLHHTGCEAVQTVGTYWYMLPLATQARKTMWDAVNPKTGKRRIFDMLPPEFLDPQYGATMREQDMFIRIPNGSSIQFLGSDNYDNFVGSPPIGVVFSEYALSDPSAWNYIRPILLENGGWAAFNTTPRGRNHAKKLYDMAASNDHWFAQTLTVDDTNVFTKEQIEQEYRELRDQMGEDDARSFIQQEYYCSWDAALKGSYYGATLEAMERMDPSRITSVPYDRGFPVQVWWDLGIGDDCALWFTQKVGRETRVIDCYSAFGKGVDHYAEVLSKRGYAYDRTACLLPHDAGHGQFSQRGGRNLSKVLSQDYHYPNKVIPRTRSLQWSINQVRSFLPTCVFDATKCEVGLDALRNYHKSYNERHKVYSNDPEHDWSSHFCDAFRTGVEGQTTPQMDTRLPELPNFTFMRDTAPHFAETEDDPLRR